MNTIKTNKKINAMTVYDIMYDAALVMAGETTFYDLKRQAFNCLGYQTFINRLKYQTLYFCQCSIDELMQQKVVVAEAFDD